MAKNGLLTRVFDLEAYGNRSPLLARSTETEIACSLPVSLGAVSCGENVGGQKD